MYRHQLADFASRFKGVMVKFRTGIETFDPHLRTVWKKGIGEAVTPLDVARYFQGVCLLFGVEGQTEAGVSNDIETALRYFEYFSVNAFVENTTTVKGNKALVDWFSHAWLDKLAVHPAAEVLLLNTDLGVG